MFWFLHSYQIMYHWLTDIEPPVFVNGCPGNIEIGASRLGRQTLVKWDPPYVTDNSGDAINPLSNIISGSAFPVGVTYVTYTATDAFGNNRSCQFSVTVSSKHNEYF